MGEVVKVSNAANTMSKVSRNEYNIPRNIPSLETDNPMIGILKIICPSLKKIWTNIVNKKSHRKGRRFRNTSDIGNFDIFIARMIKAA